MVCVTIKLPLEARTYACFHSNGTDPYPLYARTHRHRKYALAKVRLFPLKRQISARGCKSLGMFGERSTCYFCLSSVCVRGLLSPFQSVHSSRLVPSAPQDGLFRLRKAQNPCLLSLLSGE